VKVACLAQLVNVIAPIMTETGGPVWRQTIFYPFADFSNLGRGRVLRAAVDCPTYQANYFNPRGTVDAHFPLPNVPYLKLAAIHDDQTLTLFCLNRHLTEPMAMDVTTKGFANLKVTLARQLCDGDLTARNTRKDWDRVRPTPLKELKINGANLHAVLAPASWNVIRLA